MSSTQKQGIAATGRTEILQSKHEQQGGKKPHIPNLRQGGERNIHPQVIKIKMKENLTLTLFLSGIYLPLQAEASEFGTLRRRTSSK